MRRIKKSVLNGEQTDHKKKKKVFPERTQAPMTNLASGFLLPHDNPYALQYSSIQIWG